MTRRKNPLVLFCASLLLFGSATLAQAAGETGSAKDAKEMQTKRKQMAQVHRKMADCLDSDKAWSECRDEMSKGMKAAGIEHPGYRHHQQSGAAGESACPMCGEKMD